MKFSITQIQARSEQHPEQIIRRAEEDQTHLVYLDEWERFVAVKIYRREFFADPNVVQNFRERIGEIQGQYASGLAYPLDGGHENGRLFLLHQLLPGYRLSDFLRQSGPLTESNLLAVGSLVADRLEFVHRHYDVVPSLRPDDVYLHRDGPRDWTAGFSDYDLRPVRQPWTYPRETKAIQDLSLLLYELATGRRFDSFETLVESADATLADDVSESLSSLFARLLAPDAWLQPETFEDLRRALDEEAPRDEDEPDLVQPPIPPSLLPWIPDRSELTDRFQYRQPYPGLEHPGAIDAWDLLTERATRVYILPPACEEAPRLRSLIQQSVRLAHQPDAEGFTPVQSVLSDPSCCLVSEPVPEGISLWTLLQQREDLTLAEVLTLLEETARTLHQLVRGGNRLPSIQAQDVLLHPTSPPADDRPPHGHAWDRPLVRGTFRVRLRPFPTNLLFAEAPDLAELHGPPANRRRATANYFRPEWSFLALAHTMLRSIAGTERNLAPALAEVFHQAFSAASSPPAPQGFVVRLQRSARSLRPAESDSEAVSTAPRKRFLRPGSPLPRLRLGLPSYNDSAAAQTAVATLAALVLASLSSLTASRFDAEFRASAGPASKPPAQTFSGAEAKGESGSTPR